MANRSLPLLAVAGGVALLLATPTPARADGDPASDYLLGETVFYAFDSGVPSATADRLKSMVTDANARGFRVRVALIRTNTDLGSVYQLYEKPQRYAQFLGQELRFVYRGALLVVMPNGFGFAVGGRRLPPGTRALRGLRSPGPDRLAEGAMTALQRLGRAFGHEIAIPASASSSQTSDRIKIAAAALTAAALAAAVFLFRRGRERRAR